MRALRGIGLLIPLFLGPGFAQGSPASLDRFSVTQSLRAPMVNLPFCPVYSSSFAGSSVKRPSCTQREHSLSIALPRGLLRSKRMLPACIQHSPWQPVPAHLPLFQSIRMCQPSLARRQRN